MADNYIEKQQELYESRKAAWKQSKRYNCSPTKKIEKATTLHQTRRVFITGGAKGIGKSIVEHFCQRGDCVAFCDIDETNGKQTARETGAYFYALDVCHAESLENCFKQLLQSWKQIDIVINNVGINHFSSILETTTEEFDHILATNLRPIFILARIWALHCQQHASPLFYGRMINICSTRYLMSESGSEGYAASKGGIYSLTHALSMSLAPWHITVNSISPGWIQTSNYHLLRTQDHLQHPSHRVGKPEDIARMCLFLCEKENDFINGENITIDGGMTKKMIYIE